ncbi:MAG TPA: outer membrane lipid asymmetry maintenance protein MlaD [Acidiferrobacterales bacterium]|nr:outer membrane lipid asymmetry maintenance protein MlaD [Acidiferrobacterales bacterium]
MTNRKTVEIWVGVFVVIGLAALVWLAFRVGNLTTTDVANGYRVEARFENIGSLKVRSAVTLAGVRIGRVVQINTDPDSFQAVVTMNIDGRYKNLPTDTSASILTAGLLGEQYIGLEPGGAEEYLKEGSRIKLTQPAMVLEKLIGRVLTMFIDKPADNGKK